MNDDDRLGEETTMKIKDLPLRVAWRGMVMYISWSDGAALAKAIEEAGWEALEEAERKKKQKEGQKRKQHG